ncbi:Auxin response factor 2B [Camellia lanceoleosa]|uniref:Auxin response factor 2B n=1 Tax=Camellia lanceoleosa TaxID=1840588 RepID=A0ACC0HJA8_9ERIC|nr:Auxin response factor 2B [Camellia lanceoleosa]
MGSSVQTGGVIPVQTRIRSNLGAYEAKIYNNIQFANSYINLQLVWRSPAEFIVPFDQYMKSVKSNYSVGMRFKMRFEGEEAPEQKFTGTIIGIKDADTKRWAKSKWRCLKVRWDENSTIPSPERVSPRKIEPALTTAALNPLPMPRLKRPRSSMVPFSLDSSVLTREDMVALLSSLLSGQKLEQHQGNWLREPPLQLYLHISTQSRGLIPRPVLVQQPEAVKPKDGNCRLFGIPLISNHVTTELAHSHKTTIETDQGSKQIKGVNVVHKQRIALGRSVDLTKFSNYEELIAELDQLFEFNGELKARNKNWLIVFKNWLIVFTDDEGDMMLVGDDPWP